MIRVEVLAATKSGEHKFKISSVALAVGDSRDRATRGGPAISLPLAKEGGGILMRSFRVLWRAGDKL